MGSALIQLALERCLLDFLSCFHLRKRGHGGCNAEMAMHDQGQMAKYVVLIFFLCMNVHTCIHIYIHIRAYIYVNIYM